MVTVVATDYGVLHMERAIKNDRQKNIPKIEKWIANPFESQITQQQQIQEQINQPNKWQNGQLIDQKLKYQFECQMLQNKQLKQRSTECPFEQQNNYPFEPQFDQQIEQLLQSEIKQQIEYQFESQDEKQIGHQFESQIEPGLQSQFDLKIKYSYESQFEQQIENWSEPSTGQQFESQPKNDYQTEPQFEYQIKQQIDHDFDYQTESQHSYHHHSLDSNHYDQQGSQQQCYQQPSLLLPSTCCSTMPQRDLLEFAIVESLNMVSDGNSQITDANHYYDQYYQSNQIDQWMPLESIADEYCFALDVIKQTFHSRCTENFDTKHFKESIDHIDTEIIQLDSQYHYYQSYHNNDYYHCEIEQQQQQLPLDFGDYYHYQQQFQTSQASKNYNLHNNNNNNNNDNNFVEITQIPASSSTSTYHYGHYYNYPQQNNNDSNESWPLDDYHLSSSINNHETDKFSFEQNLIQSSASRSAGIGNDGPIYQTAYHQQHCHNNPDAECKYVQMQQVADENHLQTSETFYSPAMQHIDFRPPPLQQIVSPAVIGEVNNKFNINATIGGNDERRKAQNQTIKLDKKKIKQPKKKFIGGGTTRKTREDELRVWYRCAWDGCSFGSYYNGVVKRHSSKSHSGMIKIHKSSNTALHRFRCDWPGCDASLVAYHKLIEHKRKHSGEKPFQCKLNTCNYATARLYSLIIHERTHKLNTSS